MKRILVYLKPHTRDSILAPLFKLTEALLELLIPLIVASIIDVGVANGDKGYILSRCGWMIGLGLLGLLCSVTAQYFAARAATGFTASLRETLFAHIQTLSYADLDRVGTPTLLTRLTSDMNQVQNGLNLTLRLLLRSPFVVFGAMVMAFTVDAKAALVFVVTIPALFAVVFAIMLACIPLYRRVQEKLDRVLGATRENLDGVRVIRAFRLQNRETDAFSEKNADLTHMQRFVGRISALLNPLTYVIVNLAIVAILRTGAVRVDSGALTQGQVIALYNYMSQILVELIKFANLILNITRSVASGSRIGQLLEQEPSLSAPEAMPQPVDTDEKHQQREHDDEIDLVEKRGQHNDGRTAAETDALLVHVNDRHAGTSDGRRGDGRCELPEHDNPERLQPRELSPAQHPDADDVADITPEHEKHRETEPSDRRPRETDIGEHFGIEIPPEHPSHYGQPDQDRIDRIADLNLAERPSTGLFLIRHSEQ